jgi:hypothetical protein
MKVRKSHTFMVQSIDIWRLQDRIAVAREISVSLIICDDEDDVWWFRCVSRNYHGRKTGP